MASLDGENDWKKMLFLAVSAFCHHGAAIGLEISGNTGPTLLFFSNVFSLTQLQRVMALSDNSLHLSTEDQKGNA